jgi:hypothetical protein
MSQSPVRRAGLVRRGRRPSGGREPSEASRTPGHADPKCVSRLRERRLVGRGHVEALAPRPAEGLWTLWHRLRGPAIFGVSVSRETPRGDLPCARATGRKTDSTSVAFGPDPRSTSGRTKGSGRAFPLGTLGPWITCGEGCPGQSPMGGAAYACGADRRPATSPTHVVSPLDRHLAPLKDGAWLGNHRRSRSPASPRRRQQTFAPRATGRRSSWQPDWVALPTGGQGGGLGGNGRSAGGGIAGRNSCSVVPERGQSRPAGPKGSWRSRRHQPRLMDPGRRKSYVDLVGIQRSSITGACCGCAFRLRAQGIPTRLGALLGRWHVAREARIHPTSPRVGSSSVSRETRDRETAKPSVSGDARRETATWRLGSHLWRARDRTNWPAPGDRFWPSASTPATAAWVLFCHRTTNVRTHRLISRNHERRTQVGRDPVR